MARLIDATRIEQYILNNCSDNEEINTIYAEIINAPTVDAVEVVRCKDCAYWGTKAVYANGERADCLNFNFVTPCEFFCKWGERKEDADT